MSYGLGKKIAAGGFLISFLADLILTIMSLLISYTELGEDPNFYELFLKAINFFVPLISIVLIIAALGYLIMFIAERDIFKLIIFASLVINSVVSFINLGDLRFNGIIIPVIINLVFFAYYALIGFDAMKNGNAIFGLVLLGAYVFKAVIIPFFYCGMLGAEYIMVDIYTSFSYNGLPLTIIMIIDLVKAMVSLAGGVSLVIAAIKEN